MKKVTVIKKATLIVAPIIVPLTVYWIMAGTANGLGKNPAFFVGCSFYWIFWCLAFPLWLVGKKGLKDMFRSVSEPFARPAWLGKILFAIPVITAFSLIMLPLNIKNNLYPDNIWILLLIAISISLWNGILEEILWRGTFIKIFPGHWFWAFLYPALAFGFWHLAPFSINSLNLLETTIVLAGGVLFGLCWNWIAYRTGSIRYTAYSHILSNIVLITSIQLLT